MVDDKDTMQPVRCLIVPADPGFLVIPSAAVAEIVPGMGKHMTNIEY
mgnify:CR=1 FL=1